MLAETLPRLGRRQAAQVVAGADGQVQIGREGRLLQQLDGLVTSPWAARAMPRSKAMRRSSGWATSASLKAAAACL